jgi:glucosamine--fructose-6-phosphate aminotransferase (isomerizing)
MWYDCAYLKDLLAQPDAVSHTIAGLAESDAVTRFAAGLRDGHYRRVVLTGMGSSYWASKPLYLRLLAAGHTPVMVETGELIHFERDWLTPKTLVVAVSQSGRSVEILRLLELAHGKAEILAVTNTPESPLARQGAGMLLTHAGAEHTVSCKTYVATLVALEWLGELLCFGGTARLADEARAGAGSMREYLSGWQAHVNELMRTLEGARSVFVVGRGASVATAGTGGLILKESAHCDAEGMSSASFRHGPFELLSGEVFVAVLEGDEHSAALHRNLASDIVRAGGRAALISPASGGAFRAPACAASMRPLVEILPVQMMTLALAAAKGHEPGRFERASKITSVE